MRVQKWLRGGLVVLGVLVGVGLLYWFALEPWMARMGASDSEVTRSLPGDDLVPGAILRSTRSITIQASPEQVWAWVVQMGQGRGGLYSYEDLENLAGCDIHNASRILPEFQSLKVGDVFRLGPQGYPYFDVMGVEPGRALILGTQNPQIQYSGSWVFYLESAGTGQTRLIVRSLGAYQPDLGNFITWRVITEPLSFVMEQKMLRGIRDRAEGRDIPWW